MNVKQDAILDALVMAQGVGFITPGKIDAALEQLIVYQRFAEKVPELERATDRLIAKFVAGASSSVTTEDIQAIAVLITVARKLRKELVEQINNGKLLVPAELYVDLATALEPFEGKYDEQ